MLVTAESPVTVAKARTLYAHWTSRQATTFNGNGGTPEVQVRTNTMGKAYGTMPKPSWSNHVFLGWYTTAKGGVLVTAESPVTVTKTRTLYAHWTAKQATTFNGNGGTPEVQVRTNTMGKAYGTLPKAAWSNHVFLGWYTTAKGGELVTAESLVTVAKSRTLYAHWTAKQVTTFLGQGGTPEVQVRTNTIGKAFGKLPTATWAGHAFLGWYTAAEGGTRVSVNTPVKAVVERTFYAHWTDKQVTTFKGNGGSPKSQKTTNTIAMAFGTLPTATWAGHAFLGWYTEAEGGTRVSVNTPVKAVAERTFYAHWAPSKAVGKEFAISGLQVGGSAESDHSAGAKGLEPVSRGGSCTIRFEVAAGVEYEIQWTPTLLAGWTSLERLVAEEDGQAEVEVDLPAGAPLGFFRILSAGGNAAN